MSELVATLYKEHASELAAALALSTGDREAAQDLTHEVFLRAQATGDALRQERDPRAWLFRAAYSTLRNKLRLQTRRYEVARKHPTIEDQAWEEADELRVALARLTPRRRDAVVLHDYAGLEFPEIARALGGAEQHAQIDWQWGRAELDELLDTDNGVEDDRERFRSLVETSEPVHDDLLEDLRFVPITQPLGRWRVAAAVLVASLLLLGSVALFRPRESGERAAIRVSASAPSVTSFPTLAARRTTVAGSSLPPTATAEVLVPRPTAVATAAPTAVVPTGEPTPPAKRPCFGSALSTIVSEDYTEDRPVQLPPLSGAFESHIIIATVQEVEQARWSTPDGCEPETLSSGQGPQGFWSMSYGVQSPVTYRPLRLRVERTLVNRFLAPPNLRYALYGGLREGSGIQVRSSGTPPAELNGGRRYLLAVTPLLDGTEWPEQPERAEMRALVVSRALEIDGQGRVTVGGKKTPLATEIRRIRREAGPRALTPSPERLPMEWPNAVKIGGVTYLANDWAGDSLLTDADLGREFGRVQRDVGPKSYSPDVLSFRDGEATGLKPGTPLYTVNGYNPKFRLAAHAYGRLYVYDVVDNPRAKKGSDLLDIRDKVRRLQVHKLDPNAEHDPNARPVAINDPKQVGQLVDVLLGSPVGKGAAQTEPEIGYFITFEFDDGASLTRTYTPGTGEVGLGGISSVIKPPDSFAALLEAALRRNR